MIQISDNERRRAFSVWLRTGRLPNLRDTDGVAVKFNPWHDPRNGRFTFAPGGVSSSSHKRIGGFGATTIGQPGQGSKPRDPSSVGTGGPAPVANMARRPVRPGPPMGRGPNSRAFEDPMTLEQAFPGLRNSPGGAIIAVADDILGLSGPANELTAELLQYQVRQLSAQIKAIDPKWHYDEIVPVDALGSPIVTLQGLNAKVNNLRLQRAAVVARVKGDYGPLQVETLRFVQRRADSAYEDGLALLKTGRLKPNLSPNEALGNYIDRRVREDLRQRYNLLGIDSGGTGPVRVNRREYDTSGDDATYVRPDSRVTDVAFDWTLTRKTAGTQQVRGFFNTDFRPNRVVIIRPSQLGVDHTYVIARPETKR
ncbi:hypothetical protein [Sphingomonas sp. 28-63-12]|uniref:hypothetical protein n=1 Tax=Sphingomonas sp. 28-63-12 TaxID=1970434 RepID=UPI000BCF62F1|nr:MAG: hypothetical protein B7Y47_00205 [Sphingomonas sp. 28-63-12]